VTDPSVHERVVRELVADATDAGLAAIGLIRSPITGADGNVEFLLDLRASAAASIGDDEIRAVTSA
jgi:23S rRNA (cytidine1920-2'-O)/16S rRNA (cytidine1409-2'-O)-methyltransferase